MYPLIRTKAVLQMLLVISLSLFTSLSLAAPVQAQEVCCPQTEEGFCEQTDVSQCTGTTYFPGSCESFSECQIGCCDLTGKSQGCTLATTKAACIAQGGEFLPDELCNYAQCQPGCCQIGNQFTFTSEQECSQQASNYPDITPTFTAGGTEQACSERARAQEQGCCTTEEACQKTTREMCQAEAGTFFANELCSNVYTPQCSQCEAQAKTGCIDESTNVYYFDSCGNQEGIAQVCDYTQGKICGDGNADGNFECVDINCAQTWDNPVVEGDGGFRYNGESWCEYDANAGPTLDLPGSRHYRHYCFNGKEYVEPCSDLRDEICIQGGTRDLAGEVRATAICKENRGLDCFEQINQETCENRQLRDCLWLSPETEEVNIFIQQTQESLQEAQEELAQEDTQIEERDAATMQVQEVGRCIPLIAQGSAFWQETQAPQCDAATSQAPAFWQKLTQWGCKAGCASYTEDFARAQNSICQAQGDCGAKYNLAGVWTKEGFSKICDFPTNQGQPISGEGLIKDRALKDNSEYYGKSVQILIDACTEPFLEDPNTFNDIWKFYTNSLYIGQTQLQGQVQSVAQQIQQAHTATHVVGIATGAVGAILITIGSSISSFFPVGTIVAVVLIAAAAVIELVNMLIKEHQATNTFQCNVWQPPIGGTNCQLCNEDSQLTANGLHECTEYLCKSLGAACEFVPDTPEGPACIKRETVGQPLLSPLIVPENQCYQDQEANLATACAIASSQTSGYKYSTYIHPMKKFTWGIKTQDFATCKYDTQPKPFEQMLNMFAHSGFAKEHNQTIYPTIDFDAGQKYTYYVKCQDIAGNANTIDYRVEFESAQQEDLMPPIIDEYSILPASSTPANKTELDLTITLNEKVANGGGCKWAKLDVPYEEMGNYFICPNPGAFSPQQCSTSLTELQEGQNTFFFRCQDDKYPTPNTNMQSQPQGSYTLTKTKPLEIETAFCQTGYGTDCTNIQSNTFTLTVLTKVGADNGKATCEIGYSEIEPEFEFFSTGDTSMHTQSLDASDEYFIFCTDAAQNPATAKVSANILLDNSAPTIQETYVEAQNLVVITSEEATCSWTDKEVFNAQNATAFTTTGKRMHKTAATKDFYHISCSDQFNNRSPLQKVFINNL